MPGDAAWFLEEVTSLGVAYEWPEQQGLHLYSFLDPYCTRWRELGSQVLVEMPVELATAVLELQESEYVLSCISEQVRYGG